MMRSPGSCRPKSLRESSRAREQRMWRWPYWSYWSSLDHIVMILIICWSTDEVHGHWGWAEGGRTESANSWGGLFVHKMIGMIWRPMGTQFYNQEQIFMMGTHFFMMGTHLVGQNQQPRDFSWLPIDFIFIWIQIHIFIWLNIWRA